MRQEATILPSGGTENGSRQALEELLELVWENSADAMRLTDAAGRVLKVNGAYCQLTGKSREELEGQSFAVVYAAERREHILAGR